MQGSNQPQRSGITESLLQAKASAVWRHVRAQPRRHRTRTATTSATPTSAAVRRHQAPLRRQLLPRSYTQWPLRRHLCHLSRRVSLQGAAPPGTLGQAGAAEPRGRTEGGCSRGARARAPYCSSRGGRTHRYGSSGAWTARRPAVRRGGTFSFGDKVELHFPSLHVGTFDIATGHSTPAAHVTVIGTETGTETHNGPVEEGEVAVEVDAIVLPDTYTAPAGMFKPYLQAMKALLHPARKLRVQVGCRARPAAAPLPDREEAPGPRQPSATWASEDASGGRRGQKVVLAPACKRRQVAGKRRLAETEAQVTVSALHAAVLSAGGLVQVDTQVEGSNAGPGWGGRLAGAVRVLECAAREI